MSESSEQEPLTLIIGVGSPHGDDRAGWEVIDRLMEEIATEVASVNATSLQLHKAAVPHDILDWLTSDTIVHIIDASVDVAPEVRCYLIASETNKLSIRELTLNSLPATCCEQDPIACRLQLRSNSTHQFDLLASLELALALGRMPKTVLLWTITISQTKAAAALSNSTQTLVHQCARHIANSLKSPIGNPVVTSRTH